MSKSTKPKFSKLRLNGLSTRSTPVSQFFKESAEEATPIVHNVVDRKKRKSNTMNLSPEKSKRSLREPHDDNHETLKDTLRILEKKIKNAAMQITENEVATHNVVSDFFCKVADTSAEDFQENGELKKKVTSPLVTNKTCTGRKKQMDIRKTLKNKKDATTEELEEIQMAIAIKNSMTTTEQTNQDLTKLSLNQYAFRNTKHRNNESTNIMSFLTSSVQNKKCKWSKKFTNLTRRNPEAQRKKMEDNVAKVIKQSAEHHPTFKTHSYLVASKELIPLECKTKRLFLINSCETCLKDCRSNYYVDKMFEPNGLECGHLLKDWSKIPGRDVSPKSSNCDTYTSECGDIVNRLRVRSGAFNVKEFDMNVSLSESVKVTEYSSEVLTNNNQQSLELLETPLEQIPIKSFDVSKSNIIEIDSVSCYNENSMSTELHCPRSQSPDMFADYEDSFISNHNRTIEEINCSISQCKESSSSSSMCDQEDGIISYQHLSSEEAKVFNLMSFPSKRSFYDEKGNQLKIFSMNLQCGYQEKKSENDNEVIITNLHQGKETKNYGSGSMKINYLISDNQSIITQCLTEKQTVQNDKTISSISQLYHENDISTILQNLSSTVEFKDFISSKSLSMKDDVSSYNCQETEIKNLIPIEIIEKSQNNLEKSYPKGTYDFKKLNDAHENVDLDQHLPNDDDKQIFIGDRSQHYIAKNSILHDDSMRSEVKSQVKPFLGNNKFSDFLYESDNLIQDELDLLIYKSKPKSLLVNSAKSHSSSINVIEQEAGPSYYSERNHLEPCLLQEAISSVNISKTEKKHITSLRIDDDDEFIIDYNPPTKPLYRSMDEKELHKNLKSFGIRRLERKKAIQILENIYNRTHPFVELRLKKRN